MCVAWPRKRGLHGGILKGIYQTFILKFDFLLPLSFLFHEGGGGAGLKPPPSDPPLKGAIDAW